MLHGGKADTHLFCVGILQNVQGGCWIEIDIGVCKNVMSYYTDEVVVIVYPKTTACELGL